MAKNLVVILSCFLTFPFAFADEVSDWKRKLEDAQNRYQQYEKEYNQLHKRVEEIKSRADAVPNVVQGRLTWVSGTPVPTTTSKTATVIYFTPYKGSYITLYYRSQWRLYLLSEISYTLSGLTANKNYDIFIYHDYTTNTRILELSAAWNTDFVRTDALATQDGILVKSSDHTRRYLGTFRTNATATQYSFSEAFRNLWNYYNRVTYHLRVYNASNTWTYNANAWRESNNNAAIDVNFVIGVNEVLFRFRDKTNVISNAAAVRAFSTGVGVDSTTVNSALLMGIRGNGNANVEVQSWAEYDGYPGIGYHTVAWIESSPSAARVVSWGDNGGAAAGPVKSGTSGYLDM
jgi:hypothetical protein